MFGVIALFLSLIIIIVGFIMVLTGAALKIIATIMEVITDMIQAIVYLFVRFHHKKTITNKLGEADWSEKELKMIDQIEHSRRKKYEDKARKEVYEGILLFSSRMKAKYPKADPELFKKIESDFLKASDLKIFKDYEEQIKQSHIENCK